jgi:hypothetical protein
MYILDRFRQVGDEDGRHHGVHLLGAITADEALHRTRRCSVFSVPIHSDDEALRRRLPWGVRSNDAEE